MLDELRTDKITESVKPIETRGSQTAIEDSLINYLEGATCSDLLDFLSKELIRLQAEQTIQLFVYLADHRRCQRETIETGQRSKAIEQQKITEKLFDQVTDYRSEINVVVIDIRGFHWRYFLHNRLLISMVISKILSHNHYLKQLISKLDVKFTNWQKL